MHSFVLCIALDNQNLIQHSDMATIRHFWFCAAQFEFKSVAAGGFCRTHCAQRFAPFPSGGWWGWEDQQSADEQWGGKYDQKKTVQY